ncbi:MAG: hypothetical protein WC243_03515 [Patescibacteria group bacterium]|jgi:hypothetical protein
MKKLPRQFIYPVILVILLDIFFTLLGQPKEYWNNPIKVQEGSPFGVLTLSSSPWLFLSAMLIYTIIVSTALRKLPFYLGVFGTISFFLGHVWGSSSWTYTLFLKYITKNPKLEFAHWYVMVGYLLLISLTTTLWIGKYLKKNPQQVNNT